MMPKPARWAVSPGMVAPSWRWAWKGLSLAFPLMGDEYPAEVLTGTFAQKDQSGGTLGPSITEYGLAVEKVTSGAGQNLHYIWAVPDYDKPLSEATVVVLYKFTSTTDVDSWNALLIQDHTVGSQPFSSWGITQNSTNTRGYMFHCAAGGFFEAVPGHITLTIDTWYLLAGRYLSGEFFDFRTFDLDNGFAESMIEDLSPPSGNITYSGNPVHMFGSEDNPASGAPGIIPVAYVWNRALTVDELRLLARDPFGPIRPAGTLIVSLVEPSGTLHSGAGVANSSLQMVGAGTLTLILLYATADGTINSVVNEVDTTVNLYASVDDSPSSPTDTDWINNTAGTGSVFLDLTNMPSDFGTMDTLKLTVRWRGQTYIGNKSIYAQIFQSNETTSMSDEVLVATATGDSSFANTTQVTFTGLDTSSGKSVWDGARIRLRWA